MLGTHSSSKQGHGLSCSQGLSSIAMVRNGLAWGKRYGEGKELIESIFIKVESGIAVLGSCCLGSAWSSHNVGENCVCFVLEQPRTEARGRVLVPMCLGPWAHPALQCLWMSPQLTYDCLGTAMLPNSSNFLYLRCRGGKLVPKMAIQDQMMFFQ